MLKIYSMKHTSVQFGVDPRENNKKHMSTRLPIPQCGVLRNSCMNVTLSIHFQWKRLLPSDAVSFPQNRGCIKMSRVHKFHTCSLSKSTLHERRQLLHIQDRLWLILPTTFSRSGENPLWFSAECY